MDRLEKECLIFGRYLIGAAPGPEVLAKYRHYHAALAERLTERPGRFDGFLLAAARWWPQPADAYARFFQPRGLLRKKLVLLLAILESCHPSNRRVDAVDACGGFRLVVRAMLSVLLFGVSLFVGVVVLLPIHLFHKAVERGRLASGRKIAGVPPLARIDPHSLSASTRERAVV